MQPTPIPNPWNVELNNDNLEEQLEQTPYISQNQRTIEKWAERGKRALNIQ